MFIEKKMTVFLQETVNIVVFEPTLAILTVI